MSERSAVDAAGAIRRWMTEVLAESGSTPRAWAQSAGVAASTIQRAIKPDYQFVTSSRTLAKLAAVAGRPAPEIRKPNDLRYVPHYLEVRYRVQAGHWIEVDGGDFVAPEGGPYPVAPDPRYASWRQWLEEVVGDSMDRKIPPGAFVHVVDAIDMGYAAKDGDLVVVERRRGGGLLRERTVKQIVIAGERIELWPRSSNPRWQSPLLPTEGAAGEDIEVEIVGLVVGFYSPL